ncbi:M18 family aminopeptidase [Gilvimarinus polysaccharolyticus]|uniref:M18 family aminopeptidase n=1 Tax=Gilvimarinus polysaccharolyticus TaxID=863921 RepID=UPI0006732C35|nr:M18 family aminopeptidase [Gilvimarinus polysaccharolyticus]
MNDAVTRPFNDDLLQFIAASPTPFHATAEMARRLTEAGFERIHEADSWQLQAGGRYFVTRNDSSILAFVYTGEALAESGIRMVGAHTDSPCLKVKPHADVQSVGYSQVGVEVYGGVLLNTWFDRDLSIAGRITYKDTASEPCSRLIDFTTPVAVVPSLAIHLDREANRNSSINAQEDIRPLLMLTPKNDQTTTFKQLLSEQLAEQGATINASDILDYELCLYDTQKPALVGLKREFIASARLDNLLSCYVGLQALLAADGDQHRLLICTDHEEVGSASACGAKGPMLDQFLQRLIPDVNDRMRTLERSIMVSADNAHGVHPNFVQKHDAQHRPMLNGGPVIKVNANQRYATNSETSGMFRLLCEEAGVAVQSFVSRTDMECGSTIGPISAAEVGVRTIDVGVPTFAMHSIRELAGSDDAVALKQVLELFYRRPLRLGSSV